MPNWSKSAKHVELEVHRIPVTSFEDRQSEIVVFSLPGTWVEGAEVSRGDEGVVGQVTWNRVEGIDETRIGMMWVDEAYRNTDVYQQEMAWIQANLKPPFGASFSNPKLKKTIQRRYPEQGWVDENWGQWQKRHLGAAEPTWNYRGRTSGMMDNMLSDAEYEQILRSHFAFVAPYWESGNFKGYAASDLQQTLSSFLGAMGARTAGEFDQFFTDATKGLHRPRQTLDYGDDPILNQFAEHAGEFDQHIETSIPDFRANMSRKINAIMTLLPQGGSFLDIAASEGSLGKTITQASGGRITSTSLDPNQALAEFFKTKLWEPSEAIIQTRRGSCTPSIKIQMHLMW
jgi:hypothetical protein